MKPLFAPTKTKPLLNRDEVREPCTEGFLSGVAGKIRKDTAGRFSTSGKPHFTKPTPAAPYPRDVIKVAALAGGAGMVERWFLGLNCDDVFEPQQLKQHLKHETIKHPDPKTAGIVAKASALRASKNRRDLALRPIVLTHTDDRRRGAPDSA